MEKNQKTDSFFLNFDFNFSIIEQLLDEDSHGRVRDQDQCQQHRECLINKNNQLKTIIKV